mgnify:FL=1
MPHAPHAQLDVAVVGAGRMGRHHARTYANLEGARLVGVVDLDLGRARAVAEQYDSAAFASVDDLLASCGGLAAATVAAPTAEHVAAAEPLLRRGVACLVEKPLAPTSAEAGALRDLARQRGVVLGVGHSERFNPAVRAVLSMGVTPRFLEIDRVSPMTFRSMDVGVVMDMMIHDLDIVLALVGSPIARTDAVGVAVLSSHEDMASARLTFTNGCVANLTASRMALNTERKLRLFSEEAYVSLDYQARTGLIVRREEHDASIAGVRSRLAEGADLSGLDYASMVNVEELKMDRESNGRPLERDPLTAELTDFLRAVREGGEPVVTADAGAAAVAAAEGVVRAIADHRWDGLELPSRSHAAAAWTGDRAGAS